MNKKQMRKKLSKFLRDQCGVKQMGHAMMGAKLFLDDAYQPMCEYLSMKNYKHFGYDWRTVPQELWEFYGSTEYKEWVCDKVSYEEMYAKFGELSEQYKEK